MVLTEQQKTILLTDGCHGTTDDGWFTLADSVELFARDDDANDPTVALYVNGEDSGQSEPRVSDYPADWRKPLLDERSLSF